MVLVVGLPLMLGIICLYFGISEGGDALMTGVGVGFLVEALLFGISEKRIKKRKEVSWWPK